MGFYTNCLVIFDKQLGKNFFRYKSWNYIWNVYSSNPLRVQLAFESKQIPMHLHWTLVEKLV